MAAYAGFSEEDYDSIFITLDKMDKIGLDGVSSELLEAGYPQESIDKYVGLFAALENVKDVAAGMDVLLDKLGEFLDAEVADWMREIAAAVNATKEA